MAKDDFNTPPDPENKRSSGNSTPRAQRGALYWGPRRGRSGYGTESIRPHLRAQLEQQKLMRPTFPPEEPEDTDRSNGSDD